MAKQIKISPIIKEYYGDFRSQESALADKGFTRSPGTFARFQISKDPQGKYRTGLDKNAQYILALPAAEKQVELQMIDELLEKLANAFPGTDFGPRSEVWKSYGEYEPRASVIPIGNSPVILNIDSNPQHLLDYCWLRVDKRIAKSLESFNQRKDDPNCQYYIENEEVEVKVAFLKKKEVNDTIVAFTRLSPTKQKWIAKSIGLPVADDSTEEYVYNQIDNMLKSGIFEYGELKGKSTINEFKSLLALSDEILEIKSLIADAIRFNIYRIGEGGVVYQGSEQLAANKEDMVKYLVSDKNQKARIVVEERVKAKKLDLV